MKILYGYRNAPDKLKMPVAAIGIFDGIHIGHRRVINKVMSYRGECKDRAVITFDPHPQAVLRPEAAPPRIMSLEHRLSIFEKMGIDAAVVIKFSDFIAMMSPEDFVRTVLVELGVKKIFVGSNFHFGRGRSGNVDKFKEIAGLYGIEVQVVSPVRRGLRVISSTWLRRLIKKGKLKEAEVLLRRPVSVYGTVVRGDARGRELGIPTANIDPHQEVIPPPGVYAVKADVDGELYDGVLNIGFRPTFYGKRPNRREEPSIEVHLIGFKGDLYGRNIEIFFIKRLRGERFFKKGDDLISSIKKDIERASLTLLGRKRSYTRIRLYKHARKSRS